MHTYVVDIRTASSCRKVQGRTNLLYLLRHRLTAAAAVVYTFTAASTGPPVTALWRVGTARRLLYTSSDDTGKGAKCKARCRIPPVLEHF